MDTDVGKELIRDIMSGILDGKKQKDHKYSRDETCELQPTEKVH